MIPPSKNKRYVRLADSPKEQYDDRPFKWHKNEKPPPPKLLGANLTFQKQAFELPNACRKTHIKINFFYVCNKESYCMFKTCCIISILNFMFPGPCTFIYSNK
jgi:hypothetical protein